MRTRWTLTQWSIDYSKWNAEKCGKRKVLNFTSFGLKTQLHIQRRVWHITDIVQLCIRALPIANYFWTTFPFGNRTIWRRFCASWIRLLDLLWTAAAAAASAVIDALRSALSFRVCLFRLSRFLYALQKKWKWKREWKRWKKNLVEDMRITLNILEGIITDDFIPSSELKSDSNKHMDQRKRNMHSIM